MTVGELIEELKKYDPKLEVLMRYNNGMGCSTCGYGSEVTTEPCVYDMETRIELCC